MSGRIRGWLRSRRYGGVSGLGYVSGQYKEGTLLALPWLVGYIACFLLVPDPFLEWSIIVISVMWIMGIAGIYAWIKTDASGKRCFPQALMRFPDGGSQKFDLVIDPSQGFVKETDLADGSEGWRWNLGRDYQYQDARADFPFVFDYMLIRQPKKPDECFQFTSFGEFFYRGMMISLGSCEHVSFSIWGWFQDPDGKYVPVGALNESSLSYAEALHKGALLGVQYFSKKENFKTMFEHERKRRMVLGRHTATLEDMVEADLEDSKHFKRSVDDGMSKVRDCVSTVMDTERPLLQRIKSKIAWILVAIALLFFVLWLFGFLPF